MSSDNLSKPPADDSEVARSSWGRPLALIAIGMIAVSVYWMYGDLVTIESLASQEQNLKTFQAEHPTLVFGIAFTVYVAVTGLSLPGASALTLVYGWYFGFTPTIILVSFASTLGATLAFLLSRFFLRDSVQRKFGERLESFNDHLERDGAFYLFQLRLIPAVPFFVINLVMGLTPMKTRTYWWVSQIGMLPGTMVYVYAGSRVPNLSVLAKEGAGAVFSASQLLQIGIAFALLGALPVTVKWILATVEKRKGAESV